MREDKTLLMTGILLVSICQSLVWFAARVKRDDRRFPWLATLAVISGGLALVFFAADLYLRSNS